MAAPGHDNYNRSLKNKTRANTQAQNGAETSLCLTAAQQNPQKCETMWLAHVSLNGCQVLTFLRESNFSFHSGKW